MSQPGQGCPRSAPRAGSPGTPGRGRAGHRLRRAPSPLSKRSQQQRRAGAAATRALLGKQGGWELISYGHLSVCSPASPIVTHPPGTARHWHSSALLLAPALGTSPGSRSATLIPTPNPEGKAASSGVRSHLMSQALLLQCKRCGELTQSSGSVRPEGRAELSLCTGEKGPGVLARRSMCGTRCGEHMTRLLAHRVRGDEVSVLCGKEHPGLSRTVPRASSRERQRHGSCSRLGLVALHRFGCPG